MDAIGLPNTPAAKINIHLGGAFGEKEESMDRWCRNFERVPENVKRRLTVENDDKAKCYSVVDLHKVWQRTGVPVVFDYHHHKFCDGGLSERDALHLAASTWPAGIRPVTHYSESASKREGRSVSPTAHSNFVDGPVDPHGLEIDCVVEAKAKELAVIQLVTGVDQSSFYDEQRGTTDEEIAEVTRKQKEKKAEKRAEMKAARCMFAYATAHSMIGTVMLIGFFLPIINFSISMIFLDAQTFRERVYIMLVNSLALSLAAGAVAAFYG